MLTISLRPTSFLMSQMQYSMLEFISHHSALSKFPLLQYLSVSECLVGIEGYTLTHEGLMIKAQSDDQNS